MFVKTPLLATIKAHPGRRAAEERRTAHPALPVMPAGPPLAAQPPIPVRRIGAGEGAEERGSQVP